MRTFDNSNYQSMKQDFNAIKISIASPEKIRSWSYGEVKKPDTINYRTIKPENGGLFCAKIFGPVKDFECICGKYKRLKYRGVVCEKCGVEVTTSKVRRERMGHIELAAPVAHIWFLRSLPSKISTLLNAPFRDIERTLYFEQYVVIDPGTTNLQYLQFLSEREFREAQESFGPSAFEASSGAEALQKMLIKLDLPLEQSLLRKELSETGSEAKRKKIVKRLKLVEDFIDSKTKPEWMILTVVPTLPPDLRPLVMLSGGRFATSDLNELYRRVINRNNRLRRLLELKAPDVIIRNEKRMLQESVDALFDNTRKSKAVKTASKRAYKSLADMVKGKQGRFRQNLLGKRVDYSGRSVIVVGPELKLHQCGLPKKMALELFKPFIYSKLEQTGLANTLKLAKRMVEGEHPEVWDILENVIREHPVLLNRAPTLHRLGIQAFEPLLIEGKAIQLHPLVCTAFNADFDGDQMAVHIPISKEAQLEARVLMMSTNNILSPANGKPIIVPTQDMILGLYYMTLSLDHQVGEGSCFAEIGEIEHAIHQKEITLHTKIKCRRKYIDMDGNECSRLFETTAGRIILYEYLPHDTKISFESVNQVLNKKVIADFINTVYRCHGAKETVIFVDRIMQLGFEYACKSGISIGKDDIVVPSTKAMHVKEAQIEVQQYSNQYAEGLITTGERYNKVVDVWSRCADKIGNDLMDILSGKIELQHQRHNPQTYPNSLFMMVDSGARGSVAQTKQLAGMRGLMTDLSGKIIETPIISNFKEGLTVLEYFNSTHGGRKGLADTALKTSNSGYFTRKLVDVAQDCIVIEEDCGTEEGVVAMATIEAGEIILPLNVSILGRTSAIDVYHPVHESIIVHSGEIITEEITEIIDEAGIDSVKVRSVLLCKSKGGICAKCYGRDLATGEMVNVGEASGVIAAQSIGEPGTQLTMNTFHIGGAAQKASVDSNVSSTYSGTIKFLHHNFVTDSNNRQIVMSRNCESVILDAGGYEKASYKLPYGAKVLVAENETIKAGQTIAEWDPFTTPIITEKSGKACFIDLIEGISMREIRDEITGMTNRAIIDSKKRTRGNTDLRPRIALLDENDNIMVLANGLEARYFLPVGAILSIKDKDLVHAGDVLARLPKEFSKSRDITGGLPRVIDLFEARQPKDHSIISELDGFVEFGKDYKSKRRIIIRSSENPESFIECFVPRGRHITVNEGDYVTKGDVLMEGNPSLQDILRVMGMEALSRYVIKEVQQVYRLQGVSINDKHIEVIVRQMLRKVEVVEPRGTTFVAGEQVDKEQFEEVNKKTINLGYEPAVGVTVLQSITKASLQTNSFLSAASFQETTRVLTEAAIAGKIDRMVGLKENVIAGRLIPAGTGAYIERLKKAAYSNSM